MDITASKEAIKTAYRRLARKYHPDVNKTEEAARRFQVDSLFPRARRGHTRMILTEIPNVQLITEAYDVLSDDEERARYDRAGYPAPHQPPASRASAAGPGPRRQRGDDLRAVCDLAFDEACLGLPEKTVTISRWSLCRQCMGLGYGGMEAAEDCATCHGRGQVIIWRPAGALGTTQGLGRCPSCRGTGAKASPALSRRFGFLEFSSMPPFPTALGLLPRMQRRWAGVCSGTDPIPGAGRGRDGIHGQVCIGTGGLCCDPSEDSPAVSAIGCGGRAARVRRAERQGTCS